MILVANAKASLFSKFRFFMFLFPFLFPEEHPKSHDIFIVQGYYIQYTPLELERVVFLHGGAMDICPFLIFGVIEKAFCCLFLRDNAASAHCIAHRHASEVAG